MQRDFEVERIASIIGARGDKCVALQFPEGLVSNACAIVDKLTCLCGRGVEFIILGETAFGACCIDDTIAASVGATLLVHFGHSRIVPQPITDRNGFCVLHILVASHPTSVADSVAAAKAIDSALPHSSRIALVTTAQFLGIARDTARVLRDTFGRAAHCPHIGELSDGEILGCTAPLLNDVDDIVFVGDGRFHVEAAIIANPTKTAWRFDPYTGATTREELDCGKLFAMRKDAIERATRAKHVGIAVSTLGRQASKFTLRRIEALLTKIGIRHTAVLMDDVSPAALAQFPEIDVWVQLACPRLSIDWSSSFPTPVLTSHEAIQAFSPPSEESVLCPMDNWAFGTSHYRQ